MFNALHNALIEWNRNTGDRQKLQHTYVTIAVMFVVIAGIVSLVDSKSGQDLLVVTVVAGAIFLVNAVLWSLLESTVIARLSGRHKK